MTSPADRARVNLDAAERVARDALTFYTDSSEPYPWHTAGELTLNFDETDGPHIALWSPTRTLDVIADARATLDRHQKARPWNGGPKCHYDGCPWPCPDAAAVLATWGGEGE